MRAIDALDRAAGRSPKSIFVEQDAVQITYTEAVDWTHRIAARTQTLGIPSGTRVAFLSTNDWRGLLFMYGLWRAGLVLVPVNVRNSAAMNIGILKQHGPSAMVYHGDVSALAREVLNVLPMMEAWCCLDRSDDSTPSLTQWMAHEGARAADVASDPMLPWTLYSTSGTTGASKGILHTHLSNYVTSVDLLFAMRVFEAKRHLVVAPMTHFAGSFIFALTFVGSTHVLMDRAEAVEVLETIERKQIQVLFLPPTVIYMMLEQADAAKHDFSSLENFVYAAAPMASEKLRQAIEMFGPVMMNMYGQAEAIGPITSLSPIEHGSAGAPVSDEILRSIGTPGLSRQVAVMREDGQMCGMGEAGEVVLRDWVSRAAYLDDNEATTNAHRWGWYHSGDIGTMDASGRITLLDRIKDVIITGGFNVYSAGVEQSLMSHPAVLQASVFGIPDDKWGEAVHAVVQLKQGQSTDIKSLQNLVRHDIGAISVPKCIDFVDELPRSATGKVLKRELRAPYWTGRERQI